MWLNIIEFAELNVRIHRRGFTFLTQNITTAAEKSKAAGAERKSQSDLGGRIF